MQKAVFCNAKGCFLLHKPMYFRQKTTKICMNKQAEVHEKRQETRILWICLSRTENNFDNIFYRQIYQKWTIYNQRKNMGCKADIN